ncbi:MAG: sulfatase-like hydrolase/transferase, partial [Planctomycetota bacterium]
MVGSRDALGEKTTNAKHVLVICIDDLNDWVGVLGGHPQASTPNIDRLAKHGVVFTNAHSQAGRCNPSRTSFLSGLQPRSTGILDNSSAFTRQARSFAKSTLQLPQHFANHGFHTAGVGKIYHITFGPDNSQFFADGGPKLDYGYLKKGDRSIKFGAYPKQED